MGIFFLPILSTQSFMPRKQSVLIKKEEDLSIREILGLSQQDVASFCGISKSLMAMIEINERSFPMGKGKTDLELVQAYIEAEKDPVDLSAYEKPEEWEMKVWTKRLAEIKMEKFRKQNELKKMEFKLKAARKLLQVCLKLRQNHPEKVDQKTALINLWEFSAIERIKENNESEQAWLKLRLKQLDENQELVEEALKKWEKGEPPENHNQ